jgi:C-terminal processing protease CtpA/Prc
MHRRFFAPCFLLIGCLAFAGATHAQADKGWFGFKVNVDVDGIFNPVLRSAVVIEIIADSPAAKGGMSAGDEIVGVEGIVIAGRPAKEVQALMQKHPGEKLRMELKRANGASYAADLIAVTPPKTP